MTTIYTSIGKEWVDVVRGWELFLISRWSGSADLIRCVMSPATKGQQKGTGPGRDGSESRPPRNCVCVCLYVGHRSSPGAIVDTSTTDSNCSHLLLLVYWRVGPKAFLYRWSWFSFLPLTNDVVLSSPTYCTDSCMGLDCRTLLRIPIRQHVLLYTYVFIGDSLLLSSMASIRIVGVTRVKRREKISRKTGKWRLCCLESKSVNIWRRYSCCYCSPLDCTSFASSCIKPENFLEFLVLDQVGRCPIHTPLVLCTQHLVYSGHKW